MVKYPFSTDPIILIYNGQSALACQQKQEKRQLKSGTHAKYVDQFTDMLAHGVISVIPEEEIKSYKGPVNYITHQEVYKDSSTAPVRVMSNSSFCNGMTTLNECLVKGPNTLADLYENLIKFRGYKQGIVYDFTKAYNSIKTTLVERHIRRLWFRQSESEPWLQYSFNAVQLQPS